ncbi:MAG TPA: tocopherol cyclase family protein [bacterium]|nr:tocopherol cyclase family protein [bacterium]
MPQATELDNANRMRWSGGKGHYEVYYLTFNHLESGCGFWIRHTMNAPLDDERGAYAQMWFSMFDSKSPDDNFGIKKKFDAAALERTDAPFKLSLGGCSLENGRLRGSMSGSGREASWDLEYSVNAKPHLHLPEMFYKKDIADTTVLSPALAAKFTGVIVANGRRFEFKNDPGCQTHLWGRKHARRWAWGHCNAFDGHPDSVFEGLTVHLKKAGVSLPPISVLYFKHAGEEYRFTELASAIVGCKGEFTTGRWAFSAKDAVRMVKGQITCGDSDMIRADYSDPDGEPSYCHNTEVASARLTFFKRKHIFDGWSEIDSIESRNAAHVEFAGRSADPKVKNVIQDIT